MIGTIFQKKHLLKLLNEFNLGPVPLDLFSKRYFKSNRCLGSNDRRFINQCSYDIIKNLCFIDANIKKLISWESRVETYLSLNLEQAIEGESSHKPHTIVSIPIWLFKLIENDYGLQEALNIGHILRKKAPIFIRVNTLKTTRQSLYNSLKKTIDVELATNSLSAIKVLQPTQFKSFNEYLEGHFEIQDLSSQLVVETLDLKGSERILDYCAGSAGKSLHLAAKLQNKGQINLYDIRQKVLINAKARLKKAGAFNTKIYFEKNELKRLKGKMDLVLVDVPCSGTGTFRRNPEQKYNFTKEKLDKLILEQRAIVKEALVYLKPNAKLLYVTCSILKKENEEQIKYFQKHYNLTPIGNSTQILPKENEGDGFFFTQMKFNA